MAIKSFRHKGLERFFATGTKRGIQAKHDDRLRLILGALNAATNPPDMNCPVWASMNYKVLGRARGRSKSAATGG